MNINDVLHGFRVTRQRKIDELDAVMTEMVYEKNGAQLVYLDRPDTNKTFAIAFKTIPEDDTGVFHILEHSVLCGSDRYPVKEPFVELLKGSLQTFLNAFTFPDKTMYPVSSRNDQDFLNLIDVYMDAVLHPAILTTPNIFRQEGWHYELEDASADPIYNGVVFNEMKGAYSSVDTVLGNEMNQLLFPDNCYGKDSGGDPVHIPELTYEQFLACHKKYYHPSNSRIFLDGTMQLDEVLAKLDSFLSPYEYLEIDSDIPMQRPVAYQERTCEYEISENDDEKGKTNISLGYVYGTFADKEILLGLSVLADVLCGTNDSPLKKAILDKGLGEDISFASGDGIQQNPIILTVRNTDPDKLGEIKQTVEEILRSLVENGIDRKLLTASFNNLEFRLRERDYGSFPRGLVFAMSSMESWLYGGDPIQNLSYDDTFASLREKLEQGWFEQLLSDALLHNDYHAVVTAVPSKTLGQKKLDREAAELHATRQSWDDAHAAEVVEKCRGFKAWQEHEDTPEQLATLPALSLEDISDKPERMPIETRVEQGVTVLQHTLNASGILYTDLYFSASGLTEEELCCASFLCDVLTRTATEQYSSLELQNEIKANMGGLDVFATVYSRVGITDSCAPYLVCTGSVLESKTGDAVRLTSEILTRSRFTDRQLILNLLRQKKMGCEQSFAMAGHNYGVSRVNAYLTSAGAVNEYFSGYSFYQWVKRQEAGFAETGDALCAKLEELYHRIFTRERMLISVTGSEQPAYVSALIEELPSVPEQQTLCRIAPLGIHREGIVVPAGVSFAVSGANLYQLHASYTGSLRVAGNILSLSYLWNTIRVKGGAYGTGFFARSNGMTAYYSYRDPNAARSLDVYAHADDYLREFCAGEENLTKYIIGTIADFEPLQTPRSIGRNASLWYLTGYTYEDACRLRHEVLHTTREDLLSLCGVLKAITDCGAVCVVGGKDKLEACGKQLDTLLTL